ncbi:hypothetical protein O59_003100 [Cellvibrio sp. BR]|nr:hypothetical protein O59_003100 [Cellvibrio sp. BR]
MGNSIQDKNLKNIIYIAKNNLNSSSKKKRQLDSCRFSFEK